MTIREYLNQLWVLHAKIQNLRDKVKKLREAALSITAPQLKPDMVQTTPDASRLESNVVEYLRMERNISNLLLIYEKLEYKIIGEIHQLTDHRYIRVLYKRYIDHKPFRQIAKEMEYSEEYTRHLCLKAEKSLENQIDYHTITHLDVL